MSIDYRIPIMKHEFHVKITQQQEIKVYHALYLTQYMKKLYATVLCTLKQSAVYWLKERGGTEWRGKVENLG
jgi:hypothetical protein